MNPDTRIIIYKGVPECEVRKKERKEEKRKREKVECISKHTEKLK
jgi:hypothetical protein